MVYIEGNLILRINRRNKGNTAGIEGSILVVFLRLLNIYRKSIILSIISLLKEIN
tara:strand:- start:12 stop:176 length:165 start_codon:yes stop_codon:yes gene_type:complete